MKVKVFKLFFITSVWRFFWAGVTRWLDDRGVTSMTPPPPYKHIQLLFFTADSFTNFHLGHVGFTSNNPLLMEPFSPNVTAQGVILHTAEASGDKWSRQRFQIQHCRSAGKTENINFTALYYKVPIAPRVTTIMKLSREGRDVRALIGDGLLVNDLHFYCYLTTDCQFKDRI